MDSASGSGGRIGRNGPTVSGPGLARRHQSGRSFFTEAANRNRKVSIRLSCHCRLPSGSACQDGCREARLEWKRLGRPPRLSPPGHTGRSGSIRNSDLTGYASLLILRDDYAARGCVLSRPVLPMNHDYRVEEQNGRRRVRSRGYFREPYDTRSCRSVVDSP